MVSTARVVLWVQVLGLVSLPWVCSFLGVHIVQGFPEASRGGCRGQCCGTEPLTCGN